jgi:hypothetical protein
MSQFATFKPADIKALFHRALSGLTSDLARLRRARLRPHQPSEAEAAAEAGAEERAAQAVLALAWALMGAGCTEAAVGVLQVGAGARGGGGRARFGSAGSAVVVALHTATGLQLSRGLSRSYSGIKRDRMPSCTQQDAACRARSPKARPVTRCVCPAFLPAMTHHY